MSRLGGDVFEWDVQRVVQWLEEEGLSDCIKSFKANRICGRALLNLSDFDIRSLQISPDSRRKLQRVLHKVKARKKHNMKRFEGGHVAERRRPNSLNTESGGEVESGSDDGWGSDEFENSEEEHSDSDAGEYIEQEEDGEPTPAVTTGLVAQLKEGLSKRFSLTNHQARDLFHAKPKFEDEICDDIYDMPPDDDDEPAIYDDPSDDTGTSDIIVQPQSECKVLSSESGEYIHAREPRKSFIEKDHEAPNSKSWQPAAPAVPSRRKVPPPPAEETYEAPDEAPDEYETFEENFPPPPQDTYEVAGDDTPQEMYEPMDHVPPGMDTYEMPGEELSQQQQDTYEVPGQDDSAAQDTYEVPGQDDSAAQDTYEVAEPMPVLPPRPPKGGAPSPGKKPNPARPLPNQSSPGAPSPGKKPSPARPLPNQSSPAPQPISNGGSVKSRKWPPVNTDPHARGREAPKPVNSSQAIAPKPAGSPHPAPKPFTVGPKPLATKPVGAKPIAPRPGIGASPRNVCPAPPPAEKSPKPAETQKMASPRAVNPGPEVPPPRPSKGGKFTSPTQKKAPYPLPATPNRNSQEPLTNRRQSESAVQAQQPTPPLQRRTTQGGPGHPCLPPRDHPRKSQPPPPSSRRHPSETDSMNSEESGSGDAPLIPVNQLSRRHSSKPLPSTPPVQHRASSNAVHDAPWFHGPIDRKVAEKSLKSFGTDGAFIVRTSSKDAEGYSMSLLHRGEVRHLRIPRSDNQYTLGDSGTMKFSNIIDLVNFYRQNQVDLKKGGSTKLTVHCPKYD